MGWEKPVNWGLMETNGIKSNYNLREEMITLEKGLRHIVIFIYTFVPTEEKGDKKGTVLFFNLAFFRPPY